jgi:hypothetical protein
LVTLRRAASIQRSPARSLALGGLATAVAVCVGVVLLVVVPVPIGRRRTGCDTDRHRGASPASNSIHQYDTAVQAAFARCKPRSRHPPT